MVTVRNKYTGEEIAEIEDTDLAGAEEALRVAVRAFREVSSMPAYRRRDCLYSVSEYLRSREVEFARTISMEAGKPIRYARKEVRRAEFTIRSSGDEAMRIHGETVPFDVEPRGEGRFAYFVRVPIGPVLSITPFNDPLNLVAHKVGPALAAGNSIINKPTTLAPLSSIRLQEAFGQSGFPDGAFQNVIAGGSSNAVKFLLGSSEIKKVTFTGGIEAARSLVRAGGIKKYSMELGSNSPVIVFDGSAWREHLDDIVDAAFESQGQNCIHAQRLLVEESIADEFTDALVERAMGLRVGDPLDEDTDIGPMITEGEARRVEEWVMEAEKMGAQALTGGRREGAIYMPTVLVDVPREARVWRDEVFGPVTVVERFRDADEAVGLANSVPYGLQAGVFTSDLGTAMRLVERLEYGAVLINDTSDFRVDTMPFGGMKMSGIGREGVRFAVEEMTEIKLAIFRK